MPTIVSVLNPKGGCGKTTVTINVAQALSHWQERVLVIDSDSQGSALEWYGRRENHDFDVVNMAKGQALFGAPKLAANYDTTIIDGSAHLVEQQRIAIKVSDYIIIPIQPSPYDFWSVDALIEQLNIYWELGDGRPPAAFLLTRTQQGTRIVGEIAEQLEHYKLRVFESRMGQRQAYVRTAAQGLTIFSSDNKQGIEETNAIGRELLEALCRPATAQATA